MCSKNIFFSYVFIFVIPPLNRNVLWQFKRLFSNEKFDSNVNLLYIKSLSTRVYDIINMCNVYASKSKFEPARVIKLYKMLNSPY